MMAKQNDKPQEQEEENKKQTESPSKKVIPQKKVVEIDLEGALLSSGNDGTTQRGQLAQDTAYSLTQGIGIAP